MVHNQRLKIARVSLLGLSFGTASALTIAAAPACSSGFASCIESHTCPADEDAAGAGGAPEPRSPTEGGAGNAGAPVGGGEAVAGDGAGIAALAVVRTTPEDAAVDVERDQVIEVEFSSELDADSVTESTFEVTGPSGRVEGDLSVDGATITFTPASPLALLATYTVVLGADISAKGASALGEQQSFAFQSRDGVFGKPERLVKEPISDLHGQATASGYVLLQWRLSGDSSMHSVATFDPFTGSWRVEPFAYGFLTSCMNDNGEAFVLAQTSNPVWSRFIGGVWSAPSLTGLTYSSRCALASDGTVMTLRPEVVGQEAQVFARPFPAGNSPLTDVMLRADASARGLLPYQRGFMALLRAETEDRIYSRIYVDGMWAAAKAVTGAGAAPNNFSFAVHGDAALFTWEDSDFKFSAAVFDGASWTRTDLASAEGGTSSAVGAKRHIAAWYNQGATYAALYDVGEGWDDPTKLGPTNGTWSGPGVGVDDIGNVLAAWPNDSEIALKRFSDATGEWEPLNAFEDQDPTQVFLSTSANGDAVLVWTNDLGVWATRFE